MVTGKLKIRPIGCNVIFYTELLYYSNDIYSSVPIRNKEVA